MALLEVTNLGIAFGGLQAVEKFALSIEKGHLYGLIGPNGAGKTPVCTSPRKAISCWTEKASLASSRLSSIRRASRARFRISVCSRI